MKKNTDIRKIITPLIKGLLMAFFLVSLGYAGSVGATIYPSGSTLNPDCAPTDANCGVLIDTTHTTPVSITDGSATSSLRSDGLFIATSTTNLSGLFAVDSVGSVSASGTLRVYGSSLFSSVSSTYVSSTVITVGDLTVLSVLTLPSNAVSDASVVNGLTIDGGTINNTPIGALTPSTGVFTFITSTDGLFVSSTFSMQNDDGVNNILQRFLTDDEYGDFSISQRSNPNPYSARNNQSFRIGFNTAQGTNRELLTQHALDIAFESFYTQSAGQEVWELHLPSYVDTSGTEWRPLSFQGHLLSSSVTPGNLAAAFTLDNLSLYARTSTSFSGFNIGRGNSSMTMTIAGGSNEILEFGANTAGITRALMGVGGFNQSRGSYVDTFSTGMIIFAGVNSVEHARFSSNGHLLINTTTDNGYLSVSGTAFINGATVLNGTVVVGGLTSFNSGFISNASSSIRAGLQVAGALNASSSLLVKNSIFVNQGSGFNSGRFTVDSSGNLSTSGTFKVGSTSQFDQNILIGNLDPGKYIQFYNSNYKIGASSGLELYTDDSIRFIEDATQRMIINSGGIVGMNYGFYSNASSSIGAGFQVAGMLNASSSLFVSSSLFIGQAPGFGAGRFNVDGLTGNINASGTVALSAKLNPTIVGGVKDTTLLNGPASVFVSGKYAYVPANVDDSIRVIDISNPTGSSTIVGGVQDADRIENVTSIFVAGKYLYAVDLIDNSLSVIDVSDPSTPAIVGYLKDNTNLWSPNSVYVSGKYAYVANQSADSLSTIDISSSTAPTIVSNVVSTTALNGASSVYVSGKYAYVANYDDDSLSIIDISNPTSSTIVGGVKNTSLLNGAISVYVSGKYAYVANLLDDSIRIIDISSSTAPVIVGGVKDSTDFDGANSVYVSGKYAYVAMGTDNSLRIIDISSSTAPSVVGGIKDNANLSGSNTVVVSGKYAYVANSQDDSLRIIDIGGIDAPTANIGNIQSNNINITENLTVGNNAYIQSALNVGAGGIFTDGGLTVMGTSTFKGITVSSTQVYMPDLAAPVATSDIVCFDAGGKLTHQSGNCTVSSQRFKHDIEDWDEGLDLVLSLNTVKYKRNSDNAEEIGLIAEQVYEVDPHFIIFEPGSTSTPRSVDYERLVIPLISAIQSQQQQIDGLLLTSMGLSSSTAYSTSEEELLYAANRPLLSAISYLTNKLATGASVIKDFLAERVTAVVGVFDKVRTNKMEMVDSATGEVYCIKIANGDWQKTLGSCDGQAVLSDTIAEPQTQIEAPPETIPDSSTVTAPNPPVSNPPESTPASETPPEISSDNPPTEVPSNFIDELVEQVQEEINNTPEPTPTPETPAAGEPPSSP